MRYICQKEKIGLAKCKIVAYRVSNGPANPMMSHRTFHSSEGGEGDDLLSNNGDRLIEGFNDGGEEGSG